MAGRFLGQLRTAPYEDLTDKSCPICTEDYNKLDRYGDLIEHAVVLPCNHIIGSACIGTWLSPLQGNNTCPHCRKVLFSTGYTTGNEIEEDSDDENERMDFEEKLEFFLSRVDVAIHIRECDRRQFLHMVPIARVDRNGINVFWRKPEVKGAWEKWRDDWREAAVSNDEKAAREAAAAMDIEILEQLDQSLIRSIQTLRFRETFLYHHVRDGARFPDSEHLARCPEYCLSPLQHRYLFKYLKELKAFEQEGLEGETDQKKWHNLRKTGQVYDTDHSCWSTSDFTIGFYA